MSNTYPWQMLQEKIDQSTPFWSMRTRAYELPNGSTSDYTFAHFERDFVVILAWKDGRACMIDQFRPPINSRVQNFPMGSIDENEEPEAAAQRELAEESGLVSSEWVNHGKYYIAPGHMNQQFWVFEAKNCTQSHGVNRDGFEQDMQLVWYTPEEFNLNIETGVINDAATLVGWLKRDGMIR